MTVSYDTGLPRLGRDLALTFNGPAGAPWVDGDLATRTSYGPDGSPVATELGFEPPAGGQHLHWTMPLPGDLQKFVDHLRAGGPATARGRTP